MTIISEAEMVERAEIYRPLGLSEGAARVAAFGRDGQPADPFDRVVEVFRALGLGESEARVAAAGHATSEAAARRAMVEASRDPEPTRYVTVGGRRMTVRQFIESGPEPPAARPRASAWRPAGRRVGLSESVASRRPVALRECRGCSVTHTRSDECPKCRRPVAA